jgi:phenylpropionate dioxygenase-like ring-hydroxylating dioxygenase large terminal subunit
MTVQWKDLASANKGLGTGPVSIDPYISESYFELEREYLFKKSWLHVARANEIPNPGDFITREIEIANASVIIVRGRDMQIRAFHNVCSHRSAKLVWAEKGSQGRFVCPYHAWTYDLEGALRGVTGEDKFVGLDRKSCGLTPVACDLWEGFIFLNFDAAPKQSLAEFLGGFADYAAGYPFDEATSVAHLEFGDLHCNWKAAIDAFQESYHLGFLHKQTLTGVFSGKDNPLSDPLAFQTYGPHRTISLWANPDHKAGPVEKLSRQFGSTINSTTGETRAATQARLFARAPGLNPARHPNWALDVNVIFPHTIWLAIPGAFTVHHFWPVAVNRTRYEAYSYYPEPKRASERFSREYGFCHFRGVVSEDVYNMEYSQKAMASRAKQVLQLQESEICIRHHLAAVDEHIRAEMAG